MTYQNSPIHTDRSLANFAVGYENHKLIADILSPIVMVDEVSGKYFKFNKENRTLYTGRAYIGPSSDVPETEGNVTEATYSCKGRGRISKIALRTDAMADVPLNLRQDAVIDAAAQLALEREMIIAAQLSTGANFAAPNTVAISTKWDTKVSNVSSADPIADVDAIIGNLWDGSNTRRVGYCGWEVWKALKNNTNILARINGGATTDKPAMVTTQMIAEMFELDEFVVGKALYHPSVGGTQTRVWGKIFGVVAVASSPSTRAASFAQTMRWSAPGPGGLVHQQWIDHSKGTMGVERHKLAVEEDEILPANDAGILLTTVVTLWPTTARARAPPMVARRTSTVRPWARSKQRRSLARMASGSPRWSAVSSFTADSCATAWLSRPARSSTSRRPAPSNSSATASCRS